MWALHILNFWTFFMIHYQLYHIWQEAKSFNLLVSSMPSINVHIVIACTKFMTATWAPLGCYIDLALILCYVFLVMKPPWTMWSLPLGILLTRGIFWGIDCWEELRFNERFSFLLFLFLLLQNECDNKVPGWENG